MTSTERPNRLVDEDYLDIIRWETDGGAVFPPHRLTKEKSKEQIVKNSPKSHNNNKNADQK